jgi:undecaprenyl-diphosphatase
MLALLNILKSIVFGIVQGITEWLPISSTGHLILLEAFMPLNVYGTDVAANTAFWDMYKVVIQFGSIIAVMVLYWKSLWPFQSDLSEKKKRSIWRLWFKIIVASVPAAIAGFLLNDWIDAKMSSPVVVAVMLIVYGVLFIYLEKREHSYTVTGIRQVSYKKAFEAGLFQCLALIPGTSRSGSTIIGETVIGFDRPTATQFSFYMAIPVMFGASLLKIIKFMVSGTAVSALGVVVLLIGMIVSFGVSWIVIRSLMAYIRRHDFTAFGKYRIVLGALVLVLALAGVL